MRDVVRLYGHEHSYDKTKHNSYRSNSLNFIRGVVSLVSLD